MSRWKIITAAALVSGLAAPAIAQVDALSLTSMTVTRHETLPNIDPDMGLACCAQVIFESGTDEDFVYVDADFAVAWTDALERINISSRDIGLQLPNEAEPRQAWGRFAYFPQVERGASSINARRPRDWPEENAGAYMNLVFQVPAGTTQAELLIGEAPNTLRIPVPIPTETTELPSAASFFDIKVNNFAQMPELTTEDRLGGEEINGRLTPTVGQLLRLDIDITPAMNLRTDSDPGENSVFFRETAFQLVGPEGTPLVNIGRSTSGSIRSDYSLSQNWDGEESPTSDMTVFFVGSGASGEYTLYFYDTAVATIELP